MGTKLFKYLSIAFVSLLFILIATLFLSKLFGPSYLVPYFIKQVQQETNGRYTVTVNSDSLKIRFISMTVHLGKTQFKRDTAVDAYSGIQFLDQFDVDASFEAFNINAFNILWYAFTEKLVVDNISLVKPSVVITKNRNYNPESTPKIDDDGQKKGAMISFAADSVLADTLAWSEFKTSGSLILPHLNVKHFEIAEARFAFYDGRKQYPIHEVQGFTFDVKGFELTNQSDFDIEEGSISIDSASSLLSKNTARLHLRGLNLHPRAFHIDSLHFGHIVDKYRINRIKGFRASWLDIGVKDVDIEGLHPNRLINDSVVFIDKASIGKASLYLFKDKEDPMINPAYKALPHEQIRNVVSQFKIDTFQLLEADLIIDMEAPKSNKPGRIRFNQTNAFITNLTNIEEELKKDAIMKIHLNARITNKVPLILDYRLDLTSEVDQFWVQCHVEPFEASVLNEFLGSQFFVEFKSGYIDNMEFNFEGNNKANVGEMDLEYTKLRMQKLQGYEGYIDGKPKTGFVSAIGNMLIPNNRSQNDKKYKPGAIYYEKEFNRDIIHGTIMSMVSGILSSTGFASKNLEKMQHKAEALDSTDLQKSEDAVIKQTEKVDKQKETEIKKEEKKAKKEGKQGE